VGAGAGSSHDAANHGISVGAAVGIGVGIGLGLCGIVAFLLFLRRRRGRPRYASEKRQNDPNGFTGARYWITGKRSEPTMPVHELYVPPVELLSDYLSEMESRSPPVESAS
jgi:hypothetical protein